MQEKEILDQCLTDGVQKIVVGAVIKHDNKSLCIKRASDDFMGELIELPSGSKDVCESLIESLKREIKEETGIDLNEEVELDYVNSFDYVSGSGKNTRQVNFLIELNEQPVVTLNPLEHIEYYWLKKEELSNYNISEHTKNTILKCI
ncbi:MAG: NUDIX domain-containing protein [candidate division SR1 bacterium]|nr:NUDIX domain-containing protein [candidate division SR1 bacterium]